MYMSVEKKSLLETEKCVITFFPLFCSVRALMGCYITDGL